MAAWCSRTPARSAFPWNGPRRRGTDSKGGLVPSRTFESCDQSTTLRTVLFPTGRCDRKHPCRSSALCNRELQSMPDLPFVWAPPGRSLGEHVIGRCGRFESVRRTKRPMPSSSPAPSRKVPTDGADHRTCRSLCSGPSWGLFHRPAGRGKLIRARDKARGKLSATGQGRGGNRTRRNSEDGCGERGTGAGNGARSLLFRLRFLLQARYGKRRVPPRPVLFSSERANGSLCLWIRHAANAASLGG